MIFFKMLILQQLFNLSDEELEFQVNDKRSLEDFVRLGAMRSIPDATTVAILLERFRKAGVIDDLFAIFEAHFSGGPGSGVTRGDQTPRFRETCHSSDQYTRGFEEMTNASLQRSHQS